MRRFTMLGSLLALAVGVWLISGNGPRLQASPETTPSVTGVWRGTFEPGPTTTPSVLEITTQDFRRFEGAMQVGDSDYEIAGVVAASGRVHIVGKGEAGILIGWLRFTDLGDDAALLDGWVMLHNADGEKEVGELLLLRSPKQPEE